MKINWFSPLDPSRTEVARFSGLCVSSLRERLILCRVSDCVSVEEEFSGQNRKPAMLPVNIYNIGNSGEHLEIAKLAVREPGVVILHDSSLLELALALGRSDPALYLPACIEDELGPEAARDFEAMFHGVCYDWHGRDQSQYDEFITAYNLHASFIRNAMGVVVHSAQAFEQVRSTFRGPLVQLNLPFNTDGEPPRRNLQPPYSIVFCGHAGPNRRLQAFVEAWAKVSRPDMLRLSLYGHVDKAGVLLDLARQLNLAQFIQVYGFVDEAVLGCALDQAHLAINLRYPTVGEASSSQLRYMSRGIATLVTDVGWYSELPDDCVIKISPMSEQAGITDALERLISGDESLLEVGDRGFRYVLDRHPVDAYVEALHVFLEEISERRFVDAIFERRVLEIMASLCEEEQDVDLLRPALSKLSNIIDSPRYLRVDQP